MILKKCNTITKEMEIDAVINRACNKKEQLIVPVQVDTQTCFSET